jgi:hypothetical protein
LLAFLFLIFLAQEELNRYDGVIFLESASVSRLAINSTMLEGGNAFRSEEADEAQKLDTRLRHPSCLLFSSILKYYDVSI